jgi:hypothetical protein
MKGLLTATFGACVLLTSCSQSEEAFESDTPTCMWEYNSEKTEFTKEQCSQARRALKELKIEFDRVIASGKLSELPLADPNSKYDTWYHNNGGLFKNTKISDVRTTFVMKTDRKFEAGYLDNIGLSRVFAMSISLTNEDLPKGSIEIVGGGIYGIEDGIARVQILRDELRKL